MDEFGLIAEIIAELGDVADAPYIAIGPGDDGAVINPTPGWQAVASIDSQVAGRHFPAAAPAELIGYRALMASVSDLAAMAANPRFVLVALTVDQLDSSWVRGLVAGMREAATVTKVAICGGNLSRGPLSITLSVHGEVPCGAAVLRSGAQVGDVVQVSGPLGGAGACVRAGLFEIHGDLCPRQQRYYRPMARVDLIDLLRKEANAAIDVSDGLLQDLSHLLKASNCGAAIESALIPISQDAELEDARSGGDDYELLATAPNLMTGFTAIGSVVSAQGIWLDEQSVTDAEGDNLGFDHFRQ